jgi:hypothetical protein
VPGTASATPLIARARAGAGVVAGPGGALLRPLPSRRGGPGRPAAHRRLERPQLAALREVWPGGASRRSGASQGWQGRTGAQTCAPRPLRPLRPCQPWYQHCQGRLPARRRCAAAAETWRRRALYRPRRYGVAGRRGVKLPLACKLTSGLDVYIWPVKFMWPFKMRSACQAAFGLQR